MLLEGSRVNKCGPIERQQIEAKLATRRQKVAEVKRRFNL
jgi:hypothetical protein